LILDLDPRSVPPAGTLTADSGAVAPFTGWVGLTRAIELALAAERGEAAAGEGESGPSTARAEEGES
jgi:hypothetical protein